MGIRSTVAEWLGTVFLPCVYLKPPYVKPTMMVSIGKLPTVTYVRTSNGKSSIVEKRLHSFFFAF